MQSVPTTINVISSNPTHVEVWSSLSVAYDRSVVFCGSPSFQLEWLSVAVVVQILVFNMFVCLMVFYATFNNISVISWRSVLLVEETGGPAENHRSVVSHWQTWSHLDMSRGPNLYPFCLGLLMNYYTCLVLYCIKEVFEIWIHSIQQTTGPLTANSNQDKLSLRERYTVFSSYFLKHTLKHILKIFQKYFKNTLKIF
jgi:energy-converting hydrogenase Eha subunit E